MYNELGDVRTTENRPGDDNKSRFEKLGRSSTTMRKNLVLIVFLVILTAARACNVMVLMEHDNVTTVCQGAKCKPHPEMFEVQKGYEICIENHAKEEVSIYVTDIIWRSRFELAYYTKEYDFEINAAGVCCEYNFGLPVEEWGKECYQQAVAGLPKNATGNLTINEEDLIPESYTKPMTKCVHTLQLKAKSGSYRVLRQKATMAKVTLTIRSKNVSHEVTLDEYDPVYYLDLTKFKLNFTKKVPILIYSSETKESSSLLQFDGELFYVESSRINEADDMIGDYQFHQNHQGETFGEIYVVPHLMCDRLPGCGCTCKTHDQSAIAKFKNREHDYNRSTNYTVTKSDFSVIDTYDAPMKGQVHVQLGNREKDITKMEGKCEVELVGTYSCPSCGDSAQVVLKATKIENEGLMHFRSKCNFDRRSIKCDLEPTKLILAGNPNWCDIWVPTAPRKKLSVHIKHFKFGQNVTGKNHVDCGRGFVVQGAWARFFEAFLGTVIVCFVIVAILGAIIYFVRQVKNARVGRYGRLGL